MTDRIVLCMKWGTLYPAEYVNVLYNAVRAHLPGPFRFICLTGEADGLAAGIEVFPIPEIGLEARHYADGAWPKIGVFSADLYGLRGRALFIDLDSVICGDLGALFELPGRLLAIDNAPWREGGPPRLMSSVFAFDLGSLPEVVARLQADRDVLVAAHGIEQVYLQAAVPDAGFWPPGWIVSFKHHLRQPIGLDRLRPPRRPPEGARIVAFHGRPRPIELIRPGRARWERFPHYGRGPVRWMQDYWQRHGGRIDTG